MRVGMENIIVNVHWHNQMSTENAIVCYETTVHT